MYVKAGDIIFKEIIPIGLKRGSLKVGINYFFVWREKRRERKLAEEQAKQAAANHN